MCFFCCVMLRVCTYTYVHIILYTLIQASLIVAVVAGVFIVRYMRAEKKNKSRRYIYYTCSIHVHWYKNCAAWRFMIYVQCTCTVH